MTGRPDGPRRLTIGEMARATGLSAKALRLYDEMDLVVPAEVDAGNGYRYYEPAQVDPARLVARLRTAGVPLARIRTVVHARPEEAVAELLSYWRGVEADTAWARTVVSSLVDDLRRQDTTMNSTTAPVRSAHRGGQGGRDAQLDGLLDRTAERSPDRSPDQGPRFSTQITSQTIFAVADGWGDGEGMAGLALDALAGLDDVEPGADPLGDLDAAVTAAGTAVEAASEGRRGTTLTALLLAADRAYLAHVGDARVYLVREGRLERLTRDHTVVQSLIEEGKLTEEEARTDERRPLLHRALGAGAPFAPDLAVRPVLPGDRFVLTTDGVHAVLTPAALADLLVADGSNPESVAAAVEEAVLAAGAPDNYGIVVVDV